MGASVWECTCWSPAATLPFLDLCPSPLPLPVALYCLHHIGCQSPDVRDVRWSGLGRRESSGIRLGSQALLLLWQQGKQPRGEGKRSSAPRQGPASLLTTAESVFVPACCLPYFLPGSPCPENQASCPRPFPVSQPPSLANSHPQVTATSHSRLEANLRCLVTNPRVPSPLFTPAAGGRDRVPSPLLTPCVSPSRPQFPVRGRGDRKPKEHLSPPFPPAGEGGFGCFHRPVPHLTPLSSGCVSRPRHLVALSGTSSSKKGPSRERAE